MKLDKSKVTLGQWDAVYDYSPDAYRLLMGGRKEGESFETVPPRASIALIWLAKVQEDPKFTFDQAEQFTLGDVDVEVGDSEDADPT